MLVGDDAPATFVIICPCTACPPLVSFTRQVVIVEQAFLRKKRTTVTKNDSYLGSALGMDGLKALLMVHSGQCKIIDSSSMGKIDHQKQQSTPA